MSTNYYQETPRNSYVHVILMLNWGEMGGREILSTKGGSGGQGKRKGRGKRERSLQVTGRGRRRKGFGGVWNWRRLFSSKLWLDGLFSSFAYLGSAVQIFCPHCSVRWFSLWWGCSGHWLNSLSKPLSIVFNSLAQLLTDCSALWLGLDGLFVQLQLYGW